VSQKVDEVYEGLSGLMFDPGKDGFMSFPHLNINFYKPS
jgi:hypothetical protein